MDEPAALPGKFGIAEVANTQITYVVVTSKYLLYQTYMI